MERVVPAVLVVSPLTDLRELVTATLNASGFAVESIDQAHLNPRYIAALAPTLVVFIPAGSTQDPCAAVQVVREHSWTASIPVLVCMTQFADGAVARLRAMGCDGLKLPFDRETLEQAARRLMGASESGAIESSASGPVDG